MQRTDLFLSLSAAALCACASAPEGAPAAAFGDPSVPLGPVVEPQTPSSGAADLELWSDPAFKRWFLDSYVAETEIEPPVSEAELRPIEDVYELMASNELDEAIRLLQKRSGEKANAVFDFLLANIHFQREELDPAVAALETAVDKYPKFRRAWQNLGLIYFRQERYDRALPALTRVIELGGSNAITYGMLGACHARAENHLSAETAYRFALLLDPAGMDWKRGLAQALFRQERFGEAASLCATLIASDPDRADFWLLQANAYVGLGQPLRAAENYELVDRLGQSTPASLNNLGDIYVNEKLFGMAVDTYARSMEMSPSGDPGHFVRAAKVLSAHGAVAETSELVETIEASYGASLEAEEQKDLLKLRAQVALATGAGDEEARVLEQVVALDPLDGDVLILLGRYNARIGNPEKAILWFERAANLEAYEADAKTGLGQVLVKEGKYSEALPFLRRALALKPRESLRVYVEQIETLAKSQGSGS